MVFQQPVAIVGIACRLPGDATTPSKLWQKLKEGYSGWAEFPQHRFDARSFYHPNPEKKGSFHVTGAHFLNEDIALFDAPFFSISASEAVALDPQQRLLLEVTYEALENGGIPMESVSGKDVGVFVSSALSEYRIHVLKDQATAPKLEGIGTDLALLSNRLSYAFNFLGPSLTIDTACSSSLTALHYACKSLLLGESSMAVVGGSHLNLTPEAFISASTLGLLSADGRCHSFDSRAQGGFGRGEGVCALVLKELSDAIKDGDLIRAVVRNTGVNQDGRTAGVTMPNGQAQMNLIRSVYESVGLNPALTPFVEAHGTGTRVGDPIEAAAIGEAFHANQRTTPLYVGSIKSNIGHLEHASGLASVIKAILMLENDSIVPNFDFRTLNNAIVAKGINLQIPEHCIPWPTGYPRRISTSNYGFGGSGAHAIIESFETTMNEVPLSPDSSDTFSIHSSSTESHVKITETLLTSGANVIVLSANDRSSTSIQAENLRQYVKQKTDEYDHFPMHELAFTLGVRRSKLPWRIAVTATTPTQLLENLDPAKISILRSKENLNVGFIFTGQGATRPQLGIRLLSQFPKFAETIHRAEACLAHLGASWNLTKELSRPAEESRLDRALISQPACTALQLGLVDLLEEWGIRPTRVMGHSSGEIAAAYSSHALTLEQCMVVAYFRGKLSSEISQTSAPRGAMLAVACSEAETLALIQESNTGDTVEIACINSHKSTTISGDFDAISQVRKTAKSRSILSRMLNVDQAYHSSHMMRIEEEYLTTLQHFLDSTATPDIEFHTSVSGTESVVSSLGPHHWVRNLVSTVDYMSAVRSICTPSEAGIEDTKPDVLIEIGPHALLATATRDILTNQMQEPPEYLPSLERHGDESISMYKLAAALWSRGSEIDLSIVNGGSNYFETPELLRDLPPYPWNHSNRYWASSPASSAVLFSKEKQHDLLGLRLSSSSTSHVLWRNSLQLDNVPWLADHKIDGQIIFPFTAYICMVIEAERQTMQEQCGMVIKLKNVEVLTALALSSAEGHELQFSMIPQERAVIDQSNPWNNFTISSRNAESEWTLHCQGQVASFVEDECQIDPNITLTQSALQEDPIKVDVPVDRLYAALNRAGLNYGIAFKRLTKLDVHRPNVSCCLETTDTESMMPHSSESSYVVHPTILDSALHSMFTVMTKSGDSATTPSYPFLPVSAKAISVHLQGGAQAPAEFDCTSTAELIGIFSKECVGSYILTSPQSLRPIIAVKDIILKAIGDTSLQAEQLPDIFHMIYWKPYPPMLRSNHSGLLRQPFSHASSVFSSGIPTLSRVAFHHIQKALTTVSESQVTPKSLRLYRYLESILRMGDDAMLRFQTPAWLDASEADVSSCREEAVNIHALGACLDRVGNHLPSILRGEVDALSTVFGDCALGKLYENESQIQVNHMLGRYVEYLAHQNPTLRILEVGGGTATATLAVLRSLHGESSSSKPFLLYDFTDISSTFFQEARLKLQSYDGTVQYKTLDITIDPSNQGFEDAQYDCIIASNVIHATPSIKDSLVNLKKLLKPGGRLLLHEVTKPSLMLLPFMVLDGWWSFADDRERNPLLSKSRWNATLRKSGFTGLDLFADDFEDLPTTSFMVTSVAGSGEKGNETVERQKALVVSHTRPDFALQQRISKAIRSYGPEVDVESLDWTTIHDVSIQSAIVIVLDDPHSPILSALDPITYASLQNLIHTSKSILWVARGLTKSQPLSNMISGFNRTVSAEVPGLNFVSLGTDIESTPPGSDAELDLISQFFHHSFNGRDHVEVNDTEFWQKDGYIVIPRMVPNEPMRQDISETIQGQPIENLSLSDIDRTLKLTLDGPGALDRLYYQESPFIKMPLAQDQVEIEVYACGVNFKDVLIAHGQVRGGGLGQECSGIVTGVGKDVASIKVGDRVCAVHDGSFATRIRVPHFHACGIPTAMSFEEAASIPIIFLTAFYSLVEVARLEAGESILIHSAAGGLGQAAITIAQERSAKIYTTVSTEEKATFIVEKYGIPRANIFHSRNTTFGAQVLEATGGTGVDVVLNSLTGEQLRVSWECVASCGRFIEVGKKDILQDRGLSMAPFEKNITFASVDLTVITKMKPRLLKQMFKEVMQMFERSVLKSVSPIEIRPLSSLPQTLRALGSGKTVGKFVLDARSGNEHVPVRLLNNHGACLRSDGAYLVVGGTGGIGRAIGAWFIQQGAGHVILASRSGRPTSETRLMELEAKRLGSRLDIVQCDVTSIEDVRRVVSMSAFPMRGVIQASAVFKDSLFQNTDVGRFNDVIGAKVHGTMNLHNALSKSDVDFFIMLSSIATIIGNRGQAAYNAANSFLDGFAQYRVNQGLPAASINLGVVSGIGVLQSEDVIQHLSTTLGSFPIDERTVMAIISAGIRGQITKLSNNQSIIGWQATNQWFMSISKFSHVAAALNMSKVETPTNLLEVPLKQQLLQAIDMATAEELVINAIREKFSALLTISREDVVLSRSLVSYGLDSLASVELRHWVRREMQAQITVLELLNTASIATLVKMIVSRSALVTVKDL